MAKKIILQNIEIDKNLIKNYGLMACNYVNSIEFAMTNGGYIPFTGERYNNTSGKIVFDANGLVTVNHTGYMKVSFNVWLGGDSNARPWIKLLEYSNQIKYADCIDDNSSNFVNLGCANIIIPVTSGQSFGLQLGFAGSLNINGGSGNKTSYMTIELI